jgi:type IV pilus biogenesis protein CpaD/CtpE
MALMVVTATVVKEEAVKGLVAWGVAAMVVEMVVVQEVAQEVAARASHVAEAAMTTTCTTILLSHNQRCR